MQQNKKAEKADKIKKAKEMLWLPLTLFAFVLIATGVLRGEVGVLFAKAIRICLECIGIG